VSLAIPSLQLRLTTNLFSNLDSKLKTNSQYLSIDHCEYKKMFLGSKVQLVRKAVYFNLTAICKVIVQTMWDPQHLKTL
jgi:hypothetical protein